MGQKWLHTWEHTFCRLPYCEKYHPPPGPSQSDIDAIRATYTPRPRRKRRRAPRCMIMHTLRSNY
eukprot:9797506-Karenia_brevis.AAC.1